MKNNQNLENYLSNASAEKKKYFIKYILFYIYYQYLYFRYIKV